MIYFGRNFGGIVAKRKKFSAEEIINKLRQVEVLVAKGQKTDEAVRQIGVTYQTFLRWRKEYGGLRSDQAKKYKTLEQENVRLKKIIAELELDKMMLKEIAGGNF
jgi:putative transposase